SKGVTHPARRKIRNREIKFGLLYYSATAKPHRYLIGAVLCSRFAHLICNGGPTLLARAIRIAASIGHCRDDHTIAVNVDVGRSRPAPDEINGVNSMNLAP